MADAVEVLKLCKERLRKDLMPDMAETYGRASDAFDSVIAFIERVDPKKIGSEK